MEIAMIREFFSELLVITIPATVMRWRFGCVSDTPPPDQAYGRITASTTP
jgi:hypothetical protein